MSEHIKRFSAWVFALAVAAALAIGTRTALAQPITSGCLFNPPLFPGVACSTDAQCQAPCDQYNPPPGSTIGDCGPNNCCRCPS